MNVPGNIRALPAGRGRIELVVHGKKGRDEVEIALKLDEAQTSELVRYICRTAGLPAPWVR